MKSEDIKAIVDALELVNAQDNFCVEFECKVGVIEFARKKFPGCTPYITCTTYLWGAYTETRPGGLCVEHHSGIISIMGFVGFSAGIGTDDIQRVTIGEPYDCLRRIVVYERDE